MIGENDDSRTYFPDGYWKKIKPDRGYVFNIINPVHPGYIEQLISHAKKQRVGVVQGEMETNTILATNEWIENLHAIPFFSKVSHLFYCLTHFIQRHGRTLHLLKEKSKPVQAERKRRKFQIQGGLGDFKTAIKEAAAKEASQIQISSLSQSNEQPQNKGNDKEMKNEDKTIF